MNIQLTPHAQEVLARYCALGESAEAVVERALDMLDAPPTMASLKAKIQVGLDDIAAGRFVALSDAAQVDAFFDDIRARGHKRLAQKQCPP